MTNIFALHNHSTVQVLVGYQSCSIWPSESCVTARNWFFKFIQKLLGASQRTNLVQVDILLLNWNKIGIEVQFTILSNISRENIWFWQWCVISLASLLTIFCTPQICKLFIQRAIVAGERWGGSILPECCISGRVELLTGLECPAFGSNWFLPYQY